jgi:riboflavin kinase/FMN adenylyltransferase
VRVSSSAIRRAIETGDLDTATALLGRAFEIPGIVVQGQQLGRKLGYPTANLARSFDQVFPLDGVYAGSCETPFGEFAAAVSIGDRPTLGDEAKTIEAYLLDYPGEELYGQAVTLKLVKRLRGQEKFDSLDALKQQMDQDVRLVEHVI